MTGIACEAVSTRAWRSGQRYTPYGSTRYQVGSLGTAKAFTAQEADPLTGLYYYHARYYDPVIGQFLSPDNVQGNVQGMDPYSYVAGNPETGRTQRSRFAHVVVRTILVVVVGRVVAIVEAVAVAILVNFPEGIQSIAGHRVAVASRILVVVVLVGGGTKMGASGCNHTGNKGSSGGHRCAELRTEPARCCHHSQL